MAILVKPVLLAVTARAGADLHRADSERTQRTETGKTGSGNDDHVRHCPIITCQRCSCFFVLCSVAGRAADPDRIALGFTMQFAFAAVRTAGEIIGLQMGLSFATFVDPASHLNMPVLARIMDMLALLLFLTFNGHLWLISLLVDTFHTLPIGGEPLNSNAFLALTKAGSLIFLNGLMLALPLITLLLTLNLALGLLNRMAPQLSIFVIGFPLTLTVGISLMAALMPLIAPFCEHLFSEIFNLLADIISELPLI